MLFLAIVLIYYRIAGLKKKGKKKLSYYYGLFSEWIVIIYLRFCGYRILYHRYITLKGEIDIVALSEDYLLFIEVKARWNRDHLQHALTSFKLQRLHHAIDIFLHRHPKLLHKEIRCDMIWVWGIIPWRHEKHIM